MMAASTPPATIPSTLFDVYRQYKTSTEVVLKWLGDNDAITSRSGVTVNRLQSAAESVYANTIQVPEAIYRAFRESVAKRRKVTNWFMSAELSAGGEMSQTTLNHIRFTEKLEKAFLTLFPNGKGVWSRRPLGKGENEAAANESRSRFERLSDRVLDPIQAPNIEEDEQAEEDEEDVEGALGPPPPASAMEALAISETSTLGDDPLTSLIRIHLLLRELDSICEKVKIYSEQTSDGTLPLPFAAWLTNAAYEAAKRLCAELIDIDKDAQEHQDVYIGVVNRFDIVFTSFSPVSKFNDFTQGRGMTFPWIAIAHFKLEWKGEQPPPAKSDWQDPLKCISSTYKEEDGVSFSKDLDAYKFILTSIGQLLRKENYESPESGFTPSDMNPLLSDISAFLESPSENPNLSLVFGLHLLLEAYRSFIWNTNAATKINCRLQALRFAKDMKEMVQKALPQSGDPMVRKILVVDASYLDEYLAENRFDLYYQSPWTAGFHMCEILHYSIDAGLRLFNSGGRVGAVLHIYNALRQLKFIAAIPLLDDLCEVFRREIFLGSLPTENFSSHFRRFLGGTVQSEASQTLTKILLDLVVPCILREVDDDVLIALVLRGATG
ncbi:uncharacterized protein PV07_12580 [Cladophialophora immunda]|uniref:DUF6604 domain-containing protein n=1 Tax=Cladophialophora immunda TaxID=569365 RepID=A0A0D2ABB1_9EURO|nr:uncharacterized protein PV07_12580 [Cladophialophora immunda]KIW22022.1 hypothetical protein PV07_12580 [Cladophialophora immunda]